MKEKIDLKKYLLSTINNEIEGQFAKYMYCKRNEKTLQDELGWQMGFSDPNNVWSDIADLYDDVSIANVSYTIHNQSSYLEKYRDIVGVYKNDNPDYYKFTSVKNANATIQNVIYLGINCK